MTEPAFSLPRPELEPVASCFVPASKELRDDRELLRRVDTKYVCAREVALRILADLANDYAALRVPTGNVATYRSLYFDTPELRSYHDHRRGRRPRQKVRIRHYPDRSVSFFEVKTKRNETVTDKRRVEIEFGDERLSSEAKEFLRTCGALDVDELRPVMRIGFHRLSLVGLHTAERVTVDVGLEAERVDGHRRSFGEVAVIEVKQAPFCVRTPIMRALIHAGLREQAMSKYTISTALLRPELRRNRLLPDMRTIERMLP